MPSRSRYFATVRRATVNPSSARSPAGPASGLGRPPPATSSGSAAAGALADDRVGADADVRGRRRARREVGVRSKLRADEVVSRHDLVAGHPEGMGDRPVPTPAELVEVRGHDLACEVAGRTATLAS